MSARCRSSATLYGAKIYQLAFRYLRNHEDAEEVTQDVLYKVFRKVGEFRGDAALSSWIYRITFNAAMSRLRSASYQRAQDEQRDQAVPDGEDALTASLQEVADWSHMADEQPAAVAAAPAPRSRRPGAPGHLPRAGRAARSPGDVDRGSQRHAAREGSDAEVATAPRPADPPQAARRFRRRPHASPADLRYVRPASADVRLKADTTSHVPYNNIAFSSRTRSRTLSSGIATSTTPGPSEPHRQCRGARARARRVVRGHEARQQPRRIRAAACR